MNVRDIEAVTHDLAQGRGAFTSRTERRGLGLRVITYLGTRKFFFANRDVQSSLETNRPRFSASTLPARLSQRHRSHTIFISRSSGSCVNKTSYKHALPRLLPPYLLDVDMLCAQRAKYTRNMSNPLQHYSPTKLQAYFEFRFP
jgi:hypothetical protein